MFESYTSVIRRFESILLILLELTNHALESSFCHLAYLRVYTGTPPVFNSPAIFRDAETGDGQGLSLDHRNDSPAHGPKPEEEESDQDGPKTLMAQVLLALLHQWDHQGPSAPCCALCHTVYNFYWRPTRDQLC